MVTVNIPSEFFDQDDLRVQASGICDLRIIRVRYYYEFKTAFLVNCKKEVLFFNNSEEPIKSIEFDLGEFLEHLHIFDSDKTSLEFHKQQSDYLSSEDRTNDDDNSIVIDLPVDCPINPYEFRTLEFCFTDQVEDYVKKNRDFIFVFDLNESYKTYISINSFSKFKLIKHYFIESNNPTLPQEQRLFYPDELDESEDIKYETTSSSIYTHVGKKIPDCNGLFLFSYDLDYHQKCWLKLGVGLGIITLIFNAALLFLITDPGSLMNAILSSMGLVNAFLLIVKGWLFENDMEKVLKYNYDYIYVVLIVLLISEAIIAFVITAFLSPVLSNFKSSMEAFVNSTFLNSSFMLSH
jgi:hypothetical protein